MSTDDWSSVDDPTPQQVRQKLRHLIHEAEKAQREEVRLGKELVEAECAFEVAWAKAMFRATGSAADLRKGEATEATEALAFAAKLAKSLHRSCTRHLDLLEKEMGVVQSIGASLRSEMELAGRDWRAA